MTINEIREKLKNFPKYPGTKQYPPASVCNDGFPSCFNLSMTEAEMHDLWKQYLKYDKDLIYSKIQPCVRHQDWSIICGDAENRYRYLTLFDMHDVGGLIIQKDASKLVESVHFTIDSMVAFLKSLGLDMRKLRIAYFEETNVTEATNGKYNVNKNYPTDQMLDYWKNNFDFTPDQFIANHNRDTMLALKLFGLQSPWGYRNEIFYEHQGKLLDIGTVEYFLFKPVFDDKGLVVDFQPFEHSFAVSAVGLQRISMILNNLTNAWEVDTIAPIVKKAKELFAVNEQAAMIITQAIRVVHRIMTDCKEYSNLNARRKEYFRNFLKPIFEYFKNDNDYENLRELLKLHAQLEAWYPELSNSIDKTVAEIKLRKKAIEEDRSIKQHGV